MHGQQNVRNKRKDLYFIHTKQRRTKAPGRRITFVISPLGVPVIQQIAIQCLPKPICYLAELIKKKERQTRLPERRYFQLRRRSLRLPQRVIPGGGGGNKLFSVGKGFISVGVVGQSALGLLKVVQKWRKAEVLSVTSTILTYSMERSPS